MNVGGHVLCGPVGLYKQQHGSCRDRELFVCFNMHEDKLVCPCYGIIMNLLKWKGWSPKLLNHSFSWLLPQCEDHHPMYIASATSNPKHCVNCICFVVLLNVWVSLGCLASCCQCILLLSIFEWFCWVVVQVLKAADVLLSASLR